MTRIYMGYIKQITNVLQSCNGKNVFIYWNGERFIQLGSPGWMELSIFQLWKKIFLIRWKVASSSQDLFNSGSPGWMELSIFQLWKKIFLIRWKVASSSQDLFNWGSPCWMELSIFQLWKKIFLIHWKVASSSQLRFALLNGTFHFSTNENILAIALVNIH